LRELIFGFSAGLLQAVSSSNPQAKPRGRRKVSPVQFERNQKGEQR
jgi:hypothetical protein